MLPHCRESMERQREMYLPTLSLLTPCNRQSAAVLLGQIRKFVQDLPRLQHGKNVSGGHSQNCSGHFFGPSFCRLLKTLIATQCLCWRLQFFLTFLTYSIDGSIDNRRGRSRLHLMTVDDIAVFPVFVIEMEQEKQNVLVVLAV